MTDAQITFDLPGLNHVATGKVRELYDVDDEHLLFVASDRLSAFDVVMKNGIPGKGKILTQISLFWLDLLGDVVPNHLVTADVDEMPEPVLTHKAAIEGRCMLVKKVKILPIESIVRGYLAGSGWKEYRQRQSVCDLPLPEGLQESSQLPEPLFTPSTKAEHGDHDENIHPDQAAEVIGKEMADRMAAASLGLYSKAREYAAGRGIIIADTKFEFGVDSAGEMVLADEVLTPDSSRFWPAGDYEPGRSQDSYDKQYVRDWLESIDFDKTHPVEIDGDVVMRTQAKYIEAFQLLTGKDPVL